MLNILLSTVMKYQITGKTDKTHLLSYKLSKITTLIVTKGDVFSV